MSRALTTHPDRQRATLRPTSGRHAFSLVEVMVVVGILSLIVLVLMAVFSSTQKAFRSAVTQTDVLEGSRAAMDLMVSDLHTMTPSGGVSNYSANVRAPVNFFVLANAAQPLLQSLPGSTVARTNLLQYFFVLGRQNTKWTAAAYVVNTASSSPLYPLYRFYAETNAVYSPWTLYNQFTSELNGVDWWTNLSHVIDGVVHLTVRPEDPKGFLINDQIINGDTNVVNTRFYDYLKDSGISDGYGEAQLFMYSNTVPATVVLEMGVMEDSTLARAESLQTNVPAAPPNDRRSLFLKNQSGAVHLFRQRVSIPNIDLSAYQ